MDTLIQLAFLALFFNAIRIMGRMYWRSSLGETQEVSKEGMDRIKNQGFSRTPVPQTILEMLREEVEKIKAGEAHVVEVREEPAPVLEIVPSPRIDWCGDCQMEHGYDCPEKPAQKKDFIGYTPDFPTFF